eukprot:TRINITY_DN2082_c0_g3_i1.p1 TRINITY_DN2082_c0_g3~~TRINITY_DN2082_c0_g3_i1.p1  ORF type:complete len:166 (-),score=27.11 TRINITY_DN2082_c0_g3_i1:160-657(-)
MMGSKVRQAFSRVCKYIRHDLPEIAFPSSLPNPPDYVKPPGLSGRSLSEHYQLIRHAFSLYAQTWQGRTPRELLQEEEVKEEQGKPQEPTMLEDIAVAAKSGIHGLRPVLQKIYVARAAAYRDALKSFVAGYQDGMAESMSGGGAGAAAGQKENATEGRAREQKT